MKLQLLRSADIDRTRWDQGIAASSQPRITALSWFLDHACPEWHALVDENYSILMPLPLRKKFGIRYVYPPFFIQQSGIFSPGDPDIKLTESLMQCIRKNFHYAEIYLHTGHRELPQWMKAFPCSNLILQLNKNPDTLQSEYSGNLKRILKKSKSPEIKQGSGDCGALISLFRNEKGKYLQTLQDDDYRRLHLIVEEAYRCGCVEHLYTGDAASPLSGAIFLKFAGRHVFFFSAASPTARAENHMHHLISSYIASHAGRDEIMDFEGSSDPGLARFYSGFGAKAETYHLISFARNGFLLKTLGGIRRLIKKSLL
jgi:hypothetical protein